MLHEQVGQLKIVRQLGAGGMGAVYLGVHAVLGVKRAIKFLLPELTQNVFLVQRFLNEARAAGKLAHRNIVQVHDVGQLANGMYFIVFDYVEGQTLANFIWQRQAPIAPHQIVRIVVQIANALRVAHSQGIVHRDLKPENVLLTMRDGNDCHVIVVDWGVVLLIDDPDAGPRTQSGVLIGTPAYMPPEQIRAGRVNAPADVYSLATIAYRMATGGWFPYQAGDSLDEYYKLTPTEICLRQLSRPAPDPRERVPHLDEAFARALLAGLDADPERRPIAQQYALMLADAAPSHGDEPTGIDLIYAYARELVDGSTLAVARPSRPPVSAPVVPSQPPRAVGRVHLESRYEIKEQLGSGGMAEVFLASAIGAEGFARTVAIKRVLPGYSETPSFAELFIAEATIAARLSHPNIVSVLDFDRDSNGRLFLVMEYVNGKDLSALLGWGSLPPSLIIFITSEMLRGLGYAHSLVDPSIDLRGVIHRDMSPQNLILSYEGAVKVADFGLAKALQGSQAEHSGSVRGKPRYMSPEQVNAEPLDNRSDLFAVGIMLWEMLAKRSLFRGIPKEVMGQVLFYDIPRPSTHHKQVPADLEAVAMKLLKRERDDRYQTAEEAIQDLVRCKAAPRDGRTELARILIQRFGRPGERAPGQPRKAVQIEVPRVPTTFGVSAAESESVVPRSRTRVKVVAGVILLGAVIGGVALLASQDRDAAPVVAATGSDSISASAPPDAIAPPLDALAAPLQPDAVPAPTAQIDAAIGSAGIQTPAVTDPPRDVSKRPEKPREQRGTLQIQSQGVVDVTIDGRGYGSTPVTAKLSPGNHKLTLEDPIRGKKKTIMVTIKGGQETVLAPTLD